MNVVFFGTSPFAVPSLDALVARGDTVTVVTQPDRPAGRGQKLTPTAVKTAALAHGLTVLEPDKLGAFGAQLRALEPDAFVVASYGKILPASLLEIPRLGPFNVHPSLLPLYRGATPLQSAIRDGRTQTGVTIIAMDAGMDTGDILAQSAAPLYAEETYGELHDRLARDGAPLLVQTLELADRGALTPQPQAGLLPETEIAATLTRPLSREDLEVSWNAPARVVVDRIRSLSPTPAARAAIEGVNVKIVHAGRAEGDVGEGAPGSTAGVEGDALLVRAADGLVALHRVIAPNKGTMTGAAFAQMRAAAPR